MTAADDLHRAVERLASTFALSGFPRMSARIFAYVLAEDRDAYTARDLAEGLQISPAAVSGGVRMLVDTRLLLRERRVGHRGDIFRIVEGDVWAGILGGRRHVIDGYLAAAQEAVEMLAEDTPGRRRLQETVDFFEFIRLDNETMVDRWRAFRADLGR